MKIWWPHIKWNAGNTKLDNHCWIEHVENQTFKMWNSTKSTWHFHICSMHFSKRKFCVHSVWIWTHFSSKIMASIFVQIGLSHAHFEHWRWFWLLFFSEMWSLSSLQFLVFFHDFLIIINLYLVVSIFYNNLSFFSNSTFPILASI